MIRALQKPALECAREEQGRSILHRFEGNLKTESRNRRRGILRLGVSSRIQTEMFAGSGVRAMVSGIVIRFIPFSHLIWQDDKLPRIMSEAQMGIKKYPCLCSGGPA